MSFSSALIWSSLGSIFSLLRESEIEPRSLLVKSKYWYLRIGVITALLQLEPPLKGTKWWTEVGSISSLFPSEPGFNSKNIPSVSFMCFVLLGLFVYACAYHDTFNHNEENRFPEDYKYMTLTYWLTRSGRLRVINPNSEPPFFHSLDLICLFFFNPLCYKISS